MKRCLGVDSGVWVSCWSEKWMLFTIYVECVLKKMGKVTRRLMSKRLCRANWRLKTAWIWSRGEWFCVWTLWARIFSHCSFNLPLFLQEKASLPFLELKQNQIHPLPQSFSPAEVCEHQHSPGSRGAFCVYQSNMHRAELLWRWGNALQGMMDLLVGYSDFYYQIKSAPWRSPDHSQIDLFWTSPIKLHNHWIL